MWSRSSKGGSPIAPTPRYLRSASDTSCSTRLVGWLLRGHPLALSVFGNVGLLLPPIAVCAIILRRRQPLGRVPAPVLGHHRDRRRPLDHRPLRLGVRRDLSSGGDRGCSGTRSSRLCGGIGPLIALLARPHRGVRGDAVGTVGLVLASYGLLVVLHLLLLRPRARPRAWRARIRSVALFQLVQVNRALLFGR